MSNKGRFTVETTFIGNINKVKMEVVKIEKGSCLIKDLRNGRSFSYGLQALEHCNVTIINE